MGEPGSPSAEPRVRVLVVESPAAFMRPIVEGLCDTDLDVVTVQSAALPEVEARFRATSAVVVVACLRVEDGTGLSLAESWLPVVALARATDMASIGRANELGTWVMPIPTNRASLDWRELVRMIRLQADRFLEAERFRALIASTSSVADASADARATVPGALGLLAAPGLDEEIAFRLKHRMARPAWLARPVHVDGPATPIEASAALPSAFASREPLDLNPLARMQLLEETNQPAGASEAFALRSLETIREAGPLRDATEAILRSSAGLSTELIARCAKVLYRLGDIDRAVALLAGVADPDSRVLAADLAKEQRRHEEALGLVERAAGTRLDTLGAVERVARWRDAIHGKPTARRAREVVPLEFGGARWTVVFEAAPVLGRTGVGVVVAAPTISRKHVVFRKRADGRAEIDDLGSQHGTFVAGVRVKAPLVIDGAVGLMLAGNLPCAVRPGSATEGGLGSIVVEVAGERWLLTFGAPAQLGPFRLEREDGRLVVRSDVRFYLPDDDLHLRRVDCRIDAGVRLRTRWEGSAELSVDDDAFELAD